MKSIATGPFTWFSIYLDLAFKTYQETYKVFCIIRRSLKVSTPYRKMLCCCPLSFHSLHKEYPGTMIRLLTRKNSLHFDLGFPTEASSNYIGCANHSQVFFSVGKWNFNTFKTKIHRCWMNSNFLSISICWSLKKKREMFANITNIYLHYQ